MRLLVAFLGAIVLVALGATPVQAHSGSYDMKYVDGSNLILLTFNTHLPVSGLEIEHDIRLYDLVGAPIPYDEVRVEVHTGANTKQLTVEGNDLVYQKTIPMLATNESKMTYTYPGPGSYTYRATFFAGGRQISSGHFAIDIGTGASGTGGFGTLKIIGAFLLGVVLTSLVKWRSAAAQDSLAAPHEAPVDVPAESVPPG